MRSSPRRRAREFVLQGLYQQQLSGNADEAIRAQLAEAAAFPRADADYFRGLWSGISGEHERLLAAFQIHAETPIGAVDLIAQHPCTRQAGIQGAPDHLARQGRLGGEVYRIRDGCRGTPVRILAPVLGQVELAVDQRVALAAGVSQEHADLHILDPARRAAILPGHADGVLALLQKSSLVDDENAVRGTEMLEDVVAAELLGGIGIPQHVAEHALCAPGPRVADLLGQLPAIFALCRAQQTFEVQAHLPPRLRPAKQPAEPFLQCSQLIPPNENARRFCRHTLLSQEVAKAYGGCRLKLNCSIRRGGRRSRLVPNVGLIGSERRAWFWSLVPGEAPRLHLGL